METRDVIPMDVTLSWNIIIKYPQSDTIENQTIELTFTKNRKDKSLGSVILTISHTNQAWGIEILNLIKSKINEVVIEQNKKLIFSKKANHVLFSFKSLMLILLFSQMFLISYDRYNSFKYTSSQSYYNLIEVWSTQPHLEDLEVAIFSVKNLNSDDIIKVSENFISNEVLKKSMRNISEVKNNKNSGALKVYGWLMVSLFVGVFSIWAYFKQTILFYGINSHILINKRSEMDFEKENSEKNKVEYYSITFILVATICGAIGNFIFNVLAA